MLRTGDPTVDLPPWSSRWWNDGIPLSPSWHLADALDQLVNLIEELTIDVGLRVEITTDEPSW